MVFSPGKIPKVHREDMIFLLEDDSEVVKEGPKDGHNGLENSGPKLNSEDEIKGREGIALKRHRRPIDVRLVAYGFQRRNSRQRHQHEWRLIRAEWRKLKKREVRINKRVQLKQSLRLEVDRLQQELDDLKLTTDLVRLIIKRTQEVVRKRSKAEISSLLEYVRWELQQQRLTTDSSSKTKTQDQTRARYISKPSIRRVLFDDPEDVGSVLNFMSYYVSTE